MLYFIKRSHFFLTFTIVAFLTGCAGTKPGDGYVDSVPDEIEKMIKKSYSSSVYAIGSSEGPAESIAVSKATAFARAEISREFQLQIDGLQKLYEESVNDKAVHEYTQAIELLSTMELKGSQVIKTMVRQDGEMFSAKVLVVISAEALKEIMDERMADITSFRASKAYAELEERVKEEQGSAD